MKCPVCKTTLKEVVVYNECYRVGIVEDDTTIVYLTEPVIIGDSTVVCIDCGNEINI